MYVQRSLIAVKERKADEAVEPTFLTCELFSHREISWSDAVGEVDEYRCGFRITVVISILLAFAYAGYATNLAIVQWLGPVCIASCGPKV